VTASTITNLFESSSSVIHHSDGRVSAAELSDGGRRVAQGLSEAGMRPGDRIAVWLPNQAAYLLCIAAAAVGRFVLVSVNTRFSAEEARSIIQRTGARLVVTDRDFRPEGANQVVMTGSDLQALSATDSPPVPQAGGGPDDPFIVFTTSGTTSQPKLVLHNQSSVAVHSSEIPQRFGYDRRSRIMVALPLCGVFGFNSLLGAIAANSQIWLPDVFEPSSVADAVETHEITALNGSDDMFHRMLLTGFDLSSITVGGYGRFNTSLDGLVERADAVGAKLTGLYGMSEVQALFSLRDPTGTVSSRERGGGALTSPSAEARIVDPTTNELLPLGAEGELQLRGPSLFSGYLAEGGGEIDHALTEAAHVTHANSQGDDSSRNSSRWFSTGDLAVMEGERTFTYLTRIGDVLRLGGFLVSPAEIEQVLTDIDGVSAAQVVAVPRPEGVRPVAFVVTSQPLDENEAIRHCAQQLAKFKVPIRVICIDQFPTTPSANGTKIKRARLRELAFEALA